MTEEELINYKYTGVRNHPHMSMRDRAGQFAPFAALSGLTEMFDEEARVVDQKKVLAEDAEEEIFETLNEINDRVGEHPKVKITYFVKDKTKNGGAYLTAKGNVKKIDTENGYIELNDERKVNLQDISNIDIEQ